MDSDWTPIGLRLGSLLIGCPTIPNQIECSSSRVAADWTAIGLRLDSDWTPLDSPFPNDFQFEIGCADQRVDSDRTPIGLRLDSLLIGCPTIPIELGVRAPASRPIGLRLDSDWTRIGLRWTLRFLMISNTKLVLITNEWTRIGLGLDSDWTPS